MKDILLKYMSKYTSLSEVEQSQIMDDLVIMELKKGTDLLKQGDCLTKNCFFVLQGCVRQYHVDEDGKEITANFYTEEQAILLFDTEESDQNSSYTYNCLEDCILVVGDVDSEQEMYQQYAGLKSMTHQMMQNYLIQSQHEFAKFMHSTPEQRYKTIIHTRPDLLMRVPQHQLASYLGMTPESLSRIKKRIQ